MAVLGVSSSIDGEAIIEAKRADGQVQSKAESEIGGESIDRPPRTYQGCRVCSGGVMELIVESSRDCVIPPRNIKRAGREIPRIRIDEPAIVEDRAARLFDDRETYF